jgi:predicted acylesterase/phospholipase RssA
MYDTLVFSGGGMKGYLLLGAIKSLEEYNILSDIKTYIGSSIGGVIGMLLNIGYSYNQIYSIFTEVDLSRFLNYNFSNVLQNLGIDNGSECMKLLKSIIKQKIPNINITFLELYKHTNKTLILNGANLYNASEIIFSHKTTPDVTILYALRITICCTPYYTPIKDGINTYVDGCFINPFPINLAPKKSKILALGIYNSRIFPNIESMEDFLYASSYTIYSALMDIAKHKYKNNIVYLICRNNLTLLDTDISHDDKIAMIHSGYQITNDYIIKNTT